MVWLIIALLLCNGCAYGLYDTPTGLWAGGLDYRTRVAIQQQQSWNNFYQWQQNNLLQQLNNTLRMRPSLGY